MRYTRTAVMAERAALRLEAVAELAPGYAAPLLNLAGEIRAAGSGGECGHGGEEWAVRVAGVVIGGPSV